MYMTCTATNTGMLGEILPHKVKSCRRSAPVPDYIIVFVHVCTFSRTCATSRASRAVQVEVAKYALWVGFHQAQLYSINASHCVRILMLSCLSREFPMMSCPGLDPMMMSAMGRSMKYALWVGFHRAQLYNISASHCVRILLLRALAGNGQLAGVRSILIFFFSPGNS